MAEVAEKEGNFSVFKMRVGGVVDARQRELIGSGMAKKNEKSESISHSMAHYLLTIHKLKETRGFARVTDIARELGLTKGSVSTAINNLKKRNLIVEEEDCKFVVLSDEGHDEVHKILSSRTMLFYLLKDVVGVSEEAAHLDSCKIEHLISEETNHKLFLFLKNLVCSCPSTKEEKKYSLGIDLCEFKTPEDFMDSQFGDSYLTQEHLEKR